MTIRIAEALRSMLLRCLIAVRERFSGLPRVVRNWYHGECIPWEDDPHSRLVLIGWDEKRHWTASVVRAIGRFHRRHWQWATGIYVTVGVGVGAALLGVWLTSSK